MTVALRPVPDCFPALTTTATPPRDDHFNRSYSSLEQRSTSRCLRSIIALPTFTQPYVLRLVVGPLFTPVRYTPSTHDSSR